MDELITQPNPTAPPKKAEQPPQSRGEKLYDMLIKDGYNENQLGKKDEFLKATQDPNKASKLYDGLRADGYTEDQLGKIDEFRNALKKKEQSTGGSNTSVSLPSGGVTGQDFLHPEKQKDYSPDYLTQQGKQEYLKNNKPYQPQKDTGFREVKPIQKPETFAIDETKDNPIQVSLRKQDEEAKKVAADYEAKHPGSWANTFPHLTHALVGLMASTVSGGAKVVRDIAGITGSQNEGERLYNKEIPQYNENGTLIGYKDGGLSDYGKKVDSGDYGNDLMGKLIIGLDSYNTATEDDDKAHPLPHNFIGNTASGLINVAPDLLAASLLPEEKAIEGASYLMKLKSAVWNPFTKVMAAKGALQGYSEAEQKGSTPPEALKESAKGALKGTVEGGTMGLLGGVAGKISESSFKALDEAGLVKNGMLTKMGLDAASDAAVFGTAPIATAVLTGQPINKDEVEAGIGTGLAFGLIKAKQTHDEYAEPTATVNQVLSDRQASALNNFMNASHEAIAEAYSLPSETGDINAKAIEYAHKAKSENDIDKKNQLAATSSTMAKASDVKGTVEAILHDKDGFVNSIQQSELPEEQKQAIIQKIEDVHNQLSPAEIAKRDLGAKINELDQHIPAVEQAAQEATDPVEKANHEVVAEKLNKEREAANNQLKKVISDEYERQVEVGKQPVQSNYDEPSESIVTTEQNESKNTEVETPKAESENKSPASLKQEDVGESQGDKGVSKKEPDKVKVTGDELDAPLLKDTDYKLAALEVNGKHAVYETNSGERLSGFYDTKEELLKNFEKNKDKLTPKLLDEKLKPKQEPPATTEEQTTNKKVVAESSTIPFAKEFVEHDIKPFAQKIASGTKELAKNIVNVLNPKFGVSNKAIDTITKNLNSRNEAETAIDKVMGGYEKLFNKMPESERIDFIDRIKTGKPQPSPELQEIADIYKELDKNLYDEISKHKESVPFKENHFRVLWEKVPGTEKEKKWFGQSKRPLEGSKGFMKKATLADMSEGIARGGVPVSTNPITLFKLAYSDAMKYITAHRMFDALKDDGFVKFVRNGKEVPDGYKKINDKIASVYFPVKEGMVKTGEWYIEENAGRLVNNHLSGDKIRENIAGRALMEIKNAYTAAELGLSGYHASAIALEGVSSDIGRGLRKMINLGLRGDLKSAGSGILDILKAPFSPKTTFSLGRSFIKLASQKGFENSEFGKKFLQNNPEAKEYIHDFFMGGGLMKQHEDLKMKSFKALKEQAGKDNYIGAMLRAVPALNEMVMSPLFDTFIPSMKVGMFMKEFPLTLKEQQSRLDKGLVTREQLARKTINFIDDRLGEMNFDNLFWDRTFKTASQMMLRSVTWKLGNLRAMGGAPIEQAQEFYNAAKEKRAPLLEPKMAWVLGLATMQIALAAVTQKMFANKDIESVKDVIAPQIDEKDSKQRLILPTYVKDITHLAYKGTVDYAKSSLAGDVSKISDIWSNSDFQKYQIYSPQESLWQNTKDITGYVMPKPISVSSLQKSIQDNEKPSTMAMSFFGFNRAPKYLTEPPIENKIFDLYNVHEGVKSKGEKEQNDLKKRVRSLYIRGKQEDAERLLNDALKNGELTMGQVRSLVRGIGSTESPAHFFYEKLPEDEKEYLWKEMTPQERQEYDPKGKVQMQIEIKEQAKPKKEKPFSIIEK